jgi:PilZ domain
MSETETFEAEAASNFDPIDNHRRFQRKRVVWAARLETASESFECIALDLSLGGARLRLSAPLVQRQRVRITFGRVGALGAEVAWVRPGMIGVRFVDGPEQIAKILGQTLPL